MINCSKIAIFGPQNEPNGPQGAIETIRLFFELTILLDLLIGVAE